MLRREWFGVGLVVLFTVAACFAAEPVQKKGTITATAEEVPVPVVNYVVASPRAFLMSAPVEGTEELSVSGAAENFARPDGTLEVPVGTRVYFSLSRDTEGVWGADAYGTIGTTLIVQWFEAVTPTDCQECAARGLVDEPVVPGGAKTGAGGAQDVSPCPWITIATDGARDTRTGPALGYTKVSVPIEFTQPGTYCVRGVVNTTVRTSSPSSTDPSGKEAGAASTLLAEDKDAVFVEVRVVDRLAPGTDSPAATTDDPDVIYNWPMPNTADTKATDPDGNDAKDSGAKQSQGPGVFLKTQQYRNVIPF